MVNYVNPLAMYQGKGGAQYGAGGWYGWQPQQFEEQQWCGWGGAGPGAATAPEWPTEPHHHFPKREPTEREPGELPSPARGDLASPGGAGGSPCARPAQPPPPRSPYEWMKKPNYQTQPNPVSWMRIVVEEQIQGSTVGCMLHVYCMSRASV
ncbi:hypothetical protein EVAR_2529_1 [Eumeta japonica]|uniref:Uncharacterized protein n=1 Tax=Eumeta variegata TaxID=151549 RepID=A0A4C1SPI8_EUMVA|nr:hypothetical protein EVAR_2529_1 [Eumeta japonica]